MMAVVVLLSLSATFAVLAFNSPLKSLPVRPLCGNQNGPAVRSGVSPPISASHCEAVYAQYDRMVAADTFPLWLYQSYAEIAEGFAAASALCLLALVLKLPASPKGDLVLSRPARRIVTSITVGGLFVFGFVEFCNVLYANTRTQFVLNVFYDVPNRLAPFAAISGLVAASVGFGVLRSRKGFPEGIKSGIVVASISTLVAQIGLLTFDSKEMILHVTMFISWPAGGFNLLSNWFVLMTAATLLILGFTYEKSGVRSLRPSDPHVHLAAEPG